MSKLEDLYNSFETLNRLGLKINKEQQKAIDEFEEELIKDEVLPALSKDIAPRLNPIKRDLVLVVEYHPGEPISVALSRKAKISDFTDAKPLTPISDIVKSNIKPTPSNSNKPTKHIENVTKGLKVTFPDGMVIWHSTAIDTYISTLEHIGFERVASLGILRSGYNIVSRQQRPTKPGCIWQHKRNEWFIYTNTNNAQKKDDLMRISEALGLGLKITDGKRGKQ